MPITSINRDDYVGAPGIIRLTSSDNLATVLAANYLTSQASIILGLNNGPFDFVVGDMVAVAASNGNAICSFSGNNFSTLILLTLSSNYLVGYSILTSAGSGTYTVPAGTVYVEYEIVGAGGGGGGVLSAALTPLGAAGGGGAGCYNKGILYGGTLGATIPYVIGAGGTGGVGAANGNSGASTVFGGTTAGGGAGGIGATGVAGTDALIVGGGLGSSSLTGAPATSITGFGQNGGSGIAVLNTFTSGNGAPSLYDSGGEPVVTAEGFADGAPGIQWGSGGSGAAGVVAGTYAGGHGAPGAVSILAFGPKSA